MIHFNIDLLHMPLFCKFNERRVKIKKKFEIMVVFRLMLMITIMGILSMPLRRSAQLKPPPKLNLWVSYPIQNKRLSKSKVSEEKKNIGRKNREEEGVREERYFWAFLFSEEDKINCQKLIKLSAKRDRGGRWVSVSLIYMEFLSP